MEESKVPYIKIVEISLPQYVNDLRVKIFIFEHPKYLINCENITIEYVLFLDELNNRLFVTWA